MAGRVQRWITCAVTASCLGLAALLCGVPAAHAAGLGGVIDGTVVDKTPGASLAAGGKAYLYKLPQGKDPQQAAEASVDAAGHFRFDFLETDASIIYEVGVDYQGAPYFSGELTFAPGETRRELTLDVYEPSDDDSVLSLDSTSIVVQPDEKTHELAVLELDSFTVAGQRTFVPNTTPRNGGPPPLLRFSLPSNATDLTPGQGMSPHDVIQVAGGFGALTPLPPGKRDLGFTYRTAYQTSSLTYSRRVIYPTRSLRVLMPAGAGNIDSPQLARQPRQAIGGKQYQVFLGTNLQPGTNVELRFSSLPGINPLTELAQPSTLPYLAGVMGLVVLALLAWYVRDRLRTPDVALAEDRRQLEMEQRELLVQLARLDDRHEAGKIADEDYHAQRDVQKAELRTIMNRLERLG